MRLKRRIDNIKTTRLLRKAFRDSGLSQSVLSGVIGVKQPQISRVLSGRFQRKTKSLDALCIHFKVNPVMRANAVKLRDYPELALCLDEVLDGSRKRERAVIRLLKSAQNLK